MIWNRLQEHEAWDLGELPDAAGSGFSSLVSRRRSQDVRLPSTLYRRGSTEAVVEEPNAGLG